MNAHQYAIAIDSIANRVDAATRLLECTRSLLDEDHRPILDMVVRHIRIYTEAMRVASRFKRGFPASPSAALIFDAARTIPHDTLETVTAEELLDAYVCCHLHSAVSAMRLIETLYLESDDRAMQSIGDALFECLHWIDTARLELEQMVAVKTKAAVAA